jgi:hypothetical protein
MNAEDKSGDVTPSQHAPPQTGLDFLKSLPQENKHVSVTEEKRGRKRSNWGDAIVPAGVGAMVGMLVGWIVAPPSNGSVYTVITAGALAFAGANIAVGIMYAINGKGRK